MIPLLKAARSRAAACLVAVAVVGLTAQTAVAADSHQLIEGSGSSWATNALNVWIANVTQNGLKVVFTSTGSATGRKDFGNATNDFAVSDIGYQGKDPQTGDTDLPCKLNTASNCRDYAYLPIVAGGTSFTYHLEVAGRLVRNLRLSGATVAKVFTGSITNWNDPAIKADNNGRSFPSLPIIPVSHAEGSGSSAQFTTYLDTQYPAIWRGYTGKPGETEYFPPSKNGIQQTGSDGVMNFISSSSGNGSIGYDEYSYALAKNYPVVKLQNAAGYYTLPTQYNVAVALQKAQINTDKNSKNYLLQKLTDVYRDTDPRTYAMSSYSYMIIPTSASDPRMNTAKRQTLVDFIFYDVCQGQAQVGPVGYSALPLNLVQASFDQTSKLKAADSKVNIARRDPASCNNPTFVKGNLKANRLAQIAPNPAACDRAGAGPCSADGTAGSIGGGPAAGGTPTAGNGGSAGGGGTRGSSGGSGAGSGTAGGGAGAGGGARGTTGGSAPGLPSGGAVSGSLPAAINPDTGQPVANGAAGNGNGDASASAVSTDLAAYRPRNMSALLGPVAALEMLAVLLVPPLVYVRLRRRRLGA